MARATWRLKSRRPLGERWLLERPQPPSLNRRGSPSRKLCGSLKSSTCTEGNPIPAFYMEFHSPKILPSEHLILQCIYPSTGSPKAQTYTLAVTLLLSSFSSSTEPFEST